MFTEVSPRFGIPGRKISVKFAFNEAQEILLTDERLYLQLQLFRKSEHFVQMIRMPDSFVNFGFKRRYMVATEYVYT